LIPNARARGKFGADWRALAALSLACHIIRPAFHDLIAYDFASLRNINIGRAKIDGAEA